MICNLPEHFYDTVLVSNITQQFVYLVMFSSVIDPASYLSMNLHTIHLITGVVTQGSGPIADVDAWIETYHVLYSSSTKSHYLIPDEDWKYVADEQGEPVVSCVYTWLNE